MSSTYMLGDQDVDVLKLACYGASAELMPVYVKEVITTRAPLDIRLLAQVCNICQPTELPVPAGADPRSVTCRRGSWLCGQGVWLGPPLRTLAVTLLLVLCAGAAGLSQLPQGGVSVLDA